MAEFQMIKLLDTEYRIFNLPSDISEYFVSNLDEYILKAQANFDTLTLMSAVAREHWTACLNARKRKMYLFIRANHSKQKATILRDLSKAEAIDEIENEHTSEAQFMRYRDLKEVALERLQTYKKIKHG